MNAARCVSCGSIAVYDKVLIEKQEWLETGGWRFLKEERIRNVCQNCVRDLFHERCRVCGTPFGNETIWRLRLRDPYSDLWGANIPVCTDCYTTRVLGRHDETDTESAGTAGAPADGGR